MLEMKTKLPFRRLDFSSLVLVDGTVSFALISGATALVGLRVHRAVRIMVLPLADCRSDWQFQLHFE